MYISTKWSVASYSQCSAYSRLLQSYGNVSVLSMFLVLGTSLSMRKLEGQAMFDVVREVAGMSGSHGFFLLVKPRVDGVAVRSAGSRGAERKSC